MHLFEFLLFWNLREHSFIAIWSLGLFPLFNDFVICNCLYVLFSRMSYGTASTYLFNLLCFFYLQFHNALYGDAKGWARRFISSLQRYVPGIMNPHTRIVQQWKQFFVITCLVAIFVDPLFFFLLSVQQVWFYLFFICGNIILIWSWIN